MTILFVLFALVVLIIIFGITYKIKGWNAAFIATGVMLIGLLVLYIAMINLIVYSMD